MSRWTDPYVQKATSSKAGGTSSTDTARAAFFYQLPQTAWDPYWFWAELTDWRGFQRLGRWPSEQEGERGVRVLLRDWSKNGGLIAKVVKSVGVEVASTYLAPKSQFRFATGSLPVARLADLAKVVGIEFELGAPLKDQGADLLGDAKGYFGQETEQNIPLPQSFLQGVPAELFKETWDSRVGTIAVFDYGCPFLRDEYALGPQQATRIRALWHQEAFGEMFSWGDSDKSVPYGRQMRWGMMEAIRSGVLDDEAGLDEAQLYRELNYLVDYDDPRRRVYASTHGAHVLDVIGGRTNPLDPRAPSDEAAKAGLIFVHMPEATAGDSAGGSLSVHLLDALHYSIDNAEDDLPLVANVSYGSTAGPHDGSSMIEQAMDELLEKRDRFAIVLAAGNSRRMGLHTSRVATFGRTALFRINVAANDNTDTFVEFWYPAEHARWLECRVRIPDGDWSEWVGVDSHVELRQRDVDQELIAALVHRDAVPNGGRSSTGGAELSMVLLALRPTAAPDDDDGVLADAGQWEVEVQVKPSDDPAVREISARIDGWIKRDDSRPFSGRVQSVFLGLQIDDADNSLSNLANGMHTVAVGGFRWSDGMPAGYSSVGTRYVGQWPMVYGLCEWDSVNPGIRASAVRSRETFLMNGTSVAAPVVARKIFNLLCQTNCPLTQDQLIEAFRQEAKMDGALVRIDENPRARRTVALEPKAVSAPAQ